MTMTICGVVAVLLGAVMVGGVLKEEFEWLNMDGSGRRLSVG